MAQKLQGMKAGMIALGCVKNRVDSEQMLGMLKNAGCILTDDPAQAEILIVNTCGFIAPAKEEAIDTILEMAEYKQTGKCRVLCATGCLTQRYGDTIRDEIPEIDVMLGVNSYEMLIPLIEKALQGEKGADIKANHAFLECGRVLTTPPYSAYIKTGDGCDNRCAYCAIPLIRGPYRSRSREAILNEMNLLAKQGVKEHILIAQDTTRYGIDMNDSLSSLLEAAAKVEGVEWLRALYMYPDELDERTLDVMAKHENICKYLDLPLQHASPSLLKAMNRRGTLEHIRKMLRGARERGFCLRTTFIVGFPGETEDDFQQLMDFTEEMQFDRMGAFTFSPEDDTPAFDMPGQLPEEIKEERLEKLMALQAKISRERNQLRIGKEEKLLVTGWQDGTYTARSSWEAPDADGEILLLCDRELIPGSFVKGRIIAADVYDLTAKAE